MVERGPANVWRRTGIAFWLAMLSIGWAVIASVASALVPIHLTLLACGFLGAFLGSSPLILLPATARFTFGRDSRFAEPRRIQGLLVLFAAGVLTTAALVVHAWPHESWTGRALSELGLLAAIFAGVFSREFSRAVRLWFRRKTGRPSRRDGHAQVVRGAGACD